MPRMRKGVRVRKFRAVGSVNGIQLGGRVFYCEWTGRTAKGAKCYSKQYITNLRERTIKHRKDGGTTKVMVADISTAGDLMSAPTKGGRATIFKSKARTSKIGPASRHCVNQGHKPGTKAMGACIRAYFAKDGKPAGGGKKKGKKKGKKRSTVRSR